MISDITQSPPLTSLPDISSSASAAGTGAMFNYSYNLTTGSTPTNGTDDDRDESLAVFEVAISATILLLAVVGNSIVVVSLMAKKGKLSRMHLMMLHLSLADLSVAFFQVLPQMVWDITFRFQGGAFLCGAVKYLQLVTMYGSAYVLLATAVDRYVAICRPFLSHKWTSRQAHLLVLVAWLASLVFSMPQLFIFSLTEVEEGTGVYDCWASFDPPWTLQLYVAWNVLSIFVAPTLTLAVLYGRISYTVWMSSKMAENQAPRYIPQAEMSLTQQQQSSSSPNSAGIGKPGKTAWHNFSSPHRSDKGGRTSMSPVLRNGNLASSSPTSLVYHHPGGQGQRPSTHPHSSESSERRKYLADAGHHNSTSSYSAAADIPPSTRLLSHHGSGHEGGRGATGSPVIVRGARAATVGISRAKMKTIKLTLTVVICYLVCWTPHYVAQIWAAFDEDMAYDNNIFFTLVLLLASVNSCTNPWIYMAFSDTICKSLVAIASSLGCRGPCCRHHSYPKRGPRGARGESRCRGSYTEPSLSSFASSCKGSSHSVYHPACHSVTANGVSRL